MCQGLSSWGSNLLGSPAAMFQTSLAHVSDVSDVSFPLARDQSLHGPAATYFQACLVFVNTAQIEATFVKIPKTGDRDLFTRTIVDPYA